ncbi:MAG: citrate/2-methylcitrate synthase [Nitrospinaceae bacterium]
MIETVDTGLDGVPVCTSDISQTALGAEGNPILLYRGYSIYDLVKGPFEESVFLLFEGDLPGRNQLASFTEKLKTWRKLDEPVIEHMGRYPEKISMMDFLLTTLSYARMFDEDYQNPLWRNRRSHPDQLADLIVQAGTRLGAKIPTIIAQGHRIRTGKKIIPPDPSLDHAANLLHMLGIAPEKDVVDVLNAILILYLDHTINCSTFTALVVESAGTDPYSPLIAAGAALKGVVHGGANELASEMFDEIGVPENAEAYIYGRLKRREIVFGFGHRLKHYKNRLESRVQIAERLGRDLAEKKGMGHYFEIYDIISRIMLKEKNRTPNADLPISLLLKIIGIPREWNTPVFQASRHFGWVANNARQRRNEGPLYRPTQKYTGPGVEAMKTYIPLENR